MIWVLAKDAAIYGIKGKGKRVLTKKAHPFTIISKHCLKEDTEELVILLFGLISFWAKLEQAGRIYTDVRTEH